MDDLSLSEDDRSSRDSDGESEDQDRRSNKSDNSDEDGQVRSEDDEDKSGDDEKSDDEDSGDETEIDVSNIRLCSEHPSGSMTRDCKKCSDGIALMRPSPAVLQKFSGAAPLSPTTPCSPVTGAGVTRSPLLLHYPKL